jgi:enamine deaminase RidA (YjgF/YER057c/UK114 family)
MSEIKRSNYSTNSPWEPVVGYSRAVRVGNQVSVSGTTATLTDGRLAYAGDVHGQTVQTIKNIEEALKLAGAELKDVVRTRIFVTDISSWREVARAHAQYFSEIRPAASMIEVKALIDPAMLVEIEADAIIIET